MLYFYFEKKNILTEKFIFYLNKIEKVKKKNV